MRSERLIREAALRLSDSGVDDARTDAALLLAHITGKPALELRIGLDLDLRDDQLAQYHSLITRRCERIPLQYLIGTQPFCGRTFQVDERVLIPRPETELLAELAVKAGRSLGKEHPRMLDLCCGSGCLAVTMSLDVHGALVDAADLSEDALAVTRRNAELLQADLRLLQGDLWQAVCGQTYDVIVSNPPYIPTQECRVLQQEVLKEPMLALDGGIDGLDFYRRIAAQAKQHLEKQGWLMVEVGIHEADAVADLFRDAGLNHVGVHQDLNGIDRIVTAQRSE